MTMLATDAFSPGQWRDFFDTVGAGAAALTGLVFVAMSLNVAVIAAQTANRYRASASLIGLTSVFMVSALVLMGGQDHQAVGAEVLVVTGIAGTLYVWGYIHTGGFRAAEQGLRGSGAKHGASLSLYRTLGSTTCYLLEMVGAVLLIAGHGFGLYMVAVGIVANFYFMISNAWLLFLGATTSHPEPPSPEHDSNRRGY